jgi:hypothetical protein
MGSEVKVSKVAHGLATGPTGTVSSPNIRRNATNFTNFTKFTAQAVDEYVQAQEAPPALTTVMQTALREYLRERGFLRTRRPWKISPKGNSGRSDVSENHDLYLTGMKK